MLNELLGEVLSQTVVDRIESEFSLPENFFDELTHQGDWSFIIKLHALFEAATSTLLTKALGREELRSVFSTLELSGYKRGKLEFINKLKLLNKDTRLFIRSLSEERNRVVHNVWNVNLNLDDHVAGLDKNQFERFVAAYGFWVPKENFQYNGSSLHRSQFVKDNPKLAIFGAALYTLIMIYVQLKVADSDRIEDVAMHISDLYGLDYRDPKIQSEVLEMCKSSFCLER